MPTRDMVSGISAPVLTCGKVPTADLNVFGRLEVAILIVVHIV